MSEERDQRIKNFLESYRALCIRHNLYLVAEEDEFNGVRICTLRVGLLGERDIEDLTEIDKSEYWL